MVELDVILHCCQCVSDESGLRCRLGGGPQIRLELRVSVRSWQSVSDEKTSQVIGRIAWLHTPMR